MDLLINASDPGGTKNDDFSNIYWSKLPMLDTSKVTSSMWEEYEEYLNDVEWCEVMDGMESGEKYNFLIRTLEEAALSVLREKPVPKHPKVPKEIKKLHKMKLKAINHS